MPCPICTGTTTSHDYGCQGALADRKTVVKPIPPKVVRTWNEMSEKVRELADSMLEDLEAEIEHPSLDGEGNEAIDVVDRLGKLSTMIRAHLSIEMKQEPEGAADINFGEQVKR